jgi:hypothetical protein
MRWVAGIIVVLVTALPGVAQEDAKSKKLPDYYPLKVGTKWTYDVDPGTGQKVQVSNQVVKNETIDGKSLAVMESVVNGMVVATEHLASTPEGVFRHRANGVSVEPPLCIVKYPFKEDESWEAEPKIGPQQLKMKLKSGKKDEEVSAPSGRYKTVSVSVETTVNGVKINSQSWHAPDVGIVKQITELGDKKITMELVKFEAGK